METENPPSIQSEKNKQIRHIIVVLVRAHRQVEYEQWLEKVRDTIVQFEGFVAMDVIREKENATANPQQGVEYVIINRFLSHADYLRWNECAELASLLEEAKDFVLRKKINVQRIGNDLFFDRPDVGSSFSRPPLYKKILIGILAVYPIVLIGNYTFMPYLNRLELPNWLGILISTCVISPLIGWFLPVISKWFEKWLYPRV